MIDESSVIHNRRMFWASVLTLIGVLIGFMLSQFTPLDPLVVAFTGAAILLVFSGGAPERSFEDIEWNMVFFLVGLFILIGGIEILGVLDKMAEISKPILEKDPLLAISISIWLSAILSGIVDNIPVSAALVAIMVKMEIGGLHEKFLYLSLVVGVNVGGNVLPIGSPANILVMSLSERFEKRITFFQFAKIGALMSIIHLIIATIYLGLLYFLLSGLA